MRRERGSNKTTIKVLFGMNLLFYIATFKTLGTFESSPLRQHYNTNTIILGRER